MQKAPRGSRPFLEAQEWKHQADLLLDKARLVELLSRYGRVSLSGSYRLNLMSSGDIDIKLVNPRITKNSAKTILNNLIRQNFFNGYIFYDWTLRSPPKGFPRGYYIGLKRNYTPFKGRKWKVDIWLVRKEYQKDAELMNMVESHLDPKSRRTILMFKKLRARKRFEIPSTAIYRAVLEEGISSEKKFLEYVKNH